MGDIWKKTKSMKYFIFFCMSTKMLLKMVMIRLVGIELFFIMKFKFFNER